MDCHSFHSTKMQWHSHELIKASKTIFHPWPTGWYFPWQKCLCIVMPCSTQTMSQHQPKLSKSCHVCSLCRVHRRCNQTKCVHPVALMIQCPKGKCLQMKAQVAVALWLGQRVKGWIHFLRAYLGSIIITIITCCLACLSICGCNDTC